MKGGLAFRIASGRLEPKHLQNRVSVAPMRILFHFHIYTHKFQCIRNLRFFDSKIACNFVYLLDRFPATFQYPSWNAAYRWCTKCYSWINYYGRIRLIEMPTNDNTFALLLKLVELPNNLIPCKLAIAIGSKKRSFAFLSLNLLIIHKKALTVCFKSILCKWMLT